MKTKKELLKYSDNLEALVEKNTVALRESEEKYREPVENNSITNTPHTV